ncbi:MAG TPA: tetratricopeptide repeat protein [bacterium]|nr:tetratricopeptide repeat protein [bacterium]
MPGLRTGTVTFLFTDIEGSTRLLQELGARYVEVLADHHRLLRAAFKDCGGQELRTQGDAFFVAFPRARDAIAAAIAAQCAIMDHRWTDGALVRVRMGLHTGEPLITATGYEGMDVHRAARICAAGHGGQILLSGTTAMLVAGSVPPGVALRDLGMHRLKDLRQPEWIFQVIDPHLPTEFRLPQSLTTLANNLPRPLTSFVGRDSEVAETKQFLSMTRLLTLTGVGGCGKTRLALQAALGLLENYADGVWLVELAGLSDPAFVPRSLASAVGIREEAGQPLLSTLMSALREKQMLVVLDNCEHLITACAQLAQALLHMCPSIRILATSREPLGIGGETIFPVTPLPLPDPLRARTVDDLMECEAIRLFVERAAAMRLTFKLTAENAPAVIAICRHLDGIPLAIELAAARIQALSIAELVARLDDRFRLLTQGSRTALARQQTLQATMDWSYQLLSEREGTMLRRLSVFAAPWTLEAAEGICADDQDAGMDVLYLLTQLVSKSLVIMDHQEREVRYHMLETVRQYARERLMRSAEAVRVRNRHLMWYLALAERSEPELVAASQTLRLTRLELEHDDLRAALSWSLENNQAESGLRLAAAVWRFWWIRGYFGEGRTWLEALLMNSEGKGTRIVRAKALQAVGIIAVLGQGDYAAGRDFLSKSLAIWRDAGDRPNIAALLDNLGTLFSVQDDHAAARALYEESLAIRRQLQDKWGLALSLNNLGFVLYRENDYSAAYALFEESLALWREQGDGQNIAKTLSNLGLVSLSRGCFAGAYRFLKESLEVRLAAGDKWGIAHSLEGFAGLAEARGAGARAARLFGAAEALRESIGAPLRPTDRPDYDRKVAAARARLTLDAFAAAWSAGRAMTLDRVVSEAMDTDGSPEGRCSNANASI